MIASHYRPRHCERSEAMTGGPIQHCTIAQPYLERENINLNRHAELVSASMVRCRSIAPWTLKQVQGDGETNFISPQLKPAP
jgi:hypothetical protein